MMHSKTDGRRFIDCIFLFFQRLQFKGRRVPHNQGEWNYLPKKCPNSQFHTPSQQQYLTSITSFLQRLPSTADAILDSIILIVDEEHFISQFYTFRRYQRTMFSLLEAWTSVEGTVGVYGPH